MKTLIERIAGVNWRTTITGILTTLTVLYGAWIALPETTRTNPAVWIPAILAALFKTLQDVNGKDKQVSGTPATGQIVGPSETEKPRVIDAPTQPRP